MSPLRLFPSILLMLALTPALPAEAQHDSSHTGDLFGDLIEIKRDLATGQPILQKRWVALPQDVYDWAYCPIPVDRFGLEIPFLQLSCDIDPAHTDRVVPIDYFGRLSAGRTRERNLRMHFDEAIDSMKAAERIALEETGRLALGTGCSPADCTTWKVIDSPLENLAIYHRLLKYGHLQTDPLEEDTSEGGDPEGGTVYHPALDEGDWAKFGDITPALLPRAGANACFTSGGFVGDCALPQPLTSADFRIAAPLLAGAADKTAKITLDLVQYMNRILHITVATDLSAAAVDTLPALIRDENGTVAAAAAGLPAPADERFVNFATVTYARADTFSRTVTVLVDQGGGVWRTTAGVSLLDFLRFVNGASAGGSMASGFVKSAHDAVRAIEFVHEYAVPADLRAEAGAATVLTMEAFTAGTSATSQSVALRAQLIDTAPVNGGTVTFTVRSAAGAVVGTPAVSGPVANGSAVASYTLPPLATAQVLTVTAEYSGAPGFAPSVGTSPLTILFVDPCAATLTPTSTNADAAGGTMSVALAIAGSCTWNAASDADWLMLSTNNGTGPATLEYIVERNLTGLARVGHVTVANQLLTVTQPSLSMVTTDFNNDGLGEIVWQHTDGTLALWALNGLELQSASYFSPANVGDPDWRVTSVADFNHDGSPDLLWHHRVNGSVAVWLMQGTTAAEGRVVFPAYDVAFALVAAADMNHDGWVDLVWQHSGDGHVVVTHLQGTQPTGSVSITAPAGGAWKLMTAADFNADEHADLVWKDQTDGRLLVTLMQGGTELSSESIAPAVPDPSWRIVSASDINRDGSVDLVWHHSITGSGVVWWMTSFQPTGPGYISPTIGGAWSLVSLR